MYGKCECSFGGSAYILATCAWILLQRFLYASSLHYDGFFALWLIFTIQHTIGNYNLCFCNCALLLLLFDSWNSILVLKLHKNLQFQTILWIAQLMILNSMGLRWNTNTKTFPQLHCSTRGILDAGNVLLLDHSQLILATEKIPSITLTIFFNFVDTFFHFFIWACINLLGVRRIKAPISSLALLEYL